MASQTRTTPRRIPKQGRARATVDAIIEAAAHLLISRGYEAATTNHIAERAGVSIGSLYEYFPDKAAIVAEVARRRISMEVAAIETALAAGADDDDGTEHASDPGSPRAALLAMVADMAERYSQSAALDTALLEQLGPLEVARFLRAAEAKVVRLTQKYLTRHTAAVRSSDQATAFVIVHALRGVLVAAAAHEPRLLRSNEFRRATAALVDRYLFN
jgi:AcrR family transcriptional regulator